VEQGLRNLFDETVGDDGGAIDVPVTVSVKIMVIHVRPALATSDRRCRCRYNRPGPRGVWPRG
jgi:hypothetical protein